MRYELLITCFALCHNTHLDILFYLNTHRTFPWLADMTIYIVMLIDRDFVIVFDFYLIYKCFIELICLIVCNLLFCSYVC